MKRELFNGIIEKEENKKRTDHPLEKLQSSDESSIDELSTDLEEYYSNIIDSDESGWSDYDGVIVPGPGSRSYRVPTLPDPTGYYYCTLQLGCRIVVAIYSVHVEVN